MRSLAGIGDDNEAGSHNFGNRPAQCPSADAEFHELIPCHNQSAIVLVMPDVLKREPVQYAVAIHGKTPMSLVFVNSLRQLGEFAGARTSGPGVRECSIFFFFRSPANLFG